MPQLDVVIDLAIVNEDTVIVLKRLVGTWVEIDDGEVGVQETECLPIKVGLVYTLGVWPPMCHGVQATPDSPFIWLDATKTTGNSAHEDPRSSPRKSVRDIAGKDQFTGLNITF